MPSWNLLFAYSALAADKKQGPHPPRFARRVRNDKFMGLDLPDG